MFCVKYLVRMRASPLNNFRSNPKKYCCHPSLLDVLTFEWSANNKGEVATAWVIFNKFYKQSFFFGYNIISLHIMSKRWLCFRLICLLVTALKKINFHIYRQLLHFSFVACITLFNIKNYNFATMSCFQKAFERCFERSFCE